MNNKILVLFSGVLGAFLMFIVRLSLDKWKNKKQKRALGKILHMDLINFYLLIYSCKNLKTFLYKANDNSSYSKLWMNFSQDLIRLIPPQVLIDVMDSYETIESLKSVNKTQSEINKFIEIYKVDEKEKTPREDILEIIEDGIKKLENEINQKEYTLEEVKKFNEEKYITLPDNK